MKPSTVALMDLLFDVRYRSVAAASIQSSPSSSSVCSWVHGEHLIRSQVESYRRRRGKIPARVSCIRSLLYHFCFRICPHKSITKQHCCSCCNTPQSDGNDKGGWGNLSATFLPRYMQSNREPTLKGWRLP